ncbi:hypothetical protein BUALT_Bualt02G0131500 [Buddleja alternifolia]|uniref:NAB domain-containing protein n=1 Tax=Buddleja alternifolia TaxID=168488 RepID=A0AAV6Y147_9LAMI|nr:hypothetical protein BUALT_Bualt02G0131500 [Buddleja alternifolia]
MVAKAAKSGGGGEAVVAASHQHQSRRNKSFNKPSWLLCTIADLDERMKMLTRKKTKENSSDSFAARANSYYHERPEILALLQDLYNNYLSLADRYCHALSKNHHHHHSSSRCSSPIPPLKFDETNEGDTGEVIDSDAESSLSFQIPSLPRTHSKEMDADMVIADVIMKTVDYEIILNELTLIEKRWGESSRKTELQKNLLDVLESERLILLNDNATLGYRVNALVEENKGLASESLFLKRKAAELARCVLKTREDYRVCMLSRKIEDLQSQIYGLEKRNKEYYEKLVKQEEKDKCKGRKSNGGDEVTLDDCLNVPSGGGGLSKCFSFKVKKVGGDENTNGRFESARASKMWEKLKKFDLFTCGPPFNSAGC